MTMEVEGKGDFTPQISPEIVTISNIGRCKIAAVCINFEALDEAETADNVEARLPLIRLQWQGSEIEETRVTYITLSQMEDDQSSIINIKTDLAKVLVKDTLAIQKFARKMYHAYNIRLTTVEYSPFVFTFQHCNDHNSSIGSDKRKLTSLLKEFLMRDDNCKTKMKYQINVQTGEMSNNYSLCHCFDLQNGGCHNKDQKKESRSQLQPTNYRLPAGVEERFEGIEQELSHQMQSIENQIDEQQRQYDDINAHLTKITECFSYGSQDTTPYITVQYPDETISSSPAACAERGQIDGQMGEKHVDDEETIDEVNQKEEENVVDERKKKGRKTDDDVQLKVSEDTVSSGNKDTSDNKTKTKPHATDVTSKEERSMQSQSTTTVKPEKGESTHMPEQEQRGLGTGTLTCDSTMRSEDDLYSDKHGHTSPYKGCSYSSSSYKRSPYGSQSKGTDQAASGSDMKMLVVSGDGYSSQSSSQYYTSQDYTTGSGSSGYGSAYPETSSYYTNDAYPGIQTDQLNFNLDRASQIFAAELARTSNQKSKEKVFESQEGRQKLRLMIESMIGDSSNWKRLSESVEEAMLDDETPIPRVEHALDTVICLDTSGSMAGEVFEKLKRTTLEFIDGIEGIATKYDIEENVALVTFGGRAKVIHHLSNDYGSLREALDKVTPGGPSPLLEGLVVSMACLTKGGLYKIDSNLKLAPRFIFISDGYPTGEEPESAVDSGSVNAQGIIQLSNAFSELATRQVNDGVPTPVIFVALGATVKMECLTSLGSYCGGVITTPEWFPQMAKYQRLTQIGADALRFIRSRGLGSSVFQAGFYDFVSQLAVDVSETDAIQIYDMVKKNMDNVVIYYGSKYSFFNVHEEPDLPSLGSRVTRGPDWMWGNQDTEGPGTILNHSLDKIVWVCWDNDHVNVYRYGQNGKYDIVTVDDQPRVTEEYSLDIGVQVERGPDWHRLYEEQDGGRGQYGVVIRTNHLGKVMVRWQNGQIHDYRCFTRSDVVVRDPIAYILETTAKLDTSEKTEADGKVDQHKERDYKWQRKDNENGWETYSDENNAKLQKAYLKNPQGSCLIQRNRKSFRVSFKALEERGIETKSSVQVRQHFLQPENVDDGGRKTTSLAGSHKEMKKKEVEMKD